MECKLCKERETEIKRILKAYSKDKKFWITAFLISVGLNILILALGAKEGIEKLLDIIIK